VSGTAQNEQEYLCRFGRIVAELSAAFSFNFIGYDPFVLLLNEYVFVVQALLCQCRSQTEKPTKKFLFARHSNSMKRLNFLRKPSNS